MIENLLRWVSSERRKFLVVQNYTNLILSGTQHLTCCKKIIIRHPSNQQKIRFCLCNYNAIYKLYYFFYHDGLNKSNNKNTLKWIKCLCREGGLCACFEMALGPLHTTCFLMVFHVFLFWHHFSLLTLVVKMM